MNRLLNDIKNCDECGCKTDEDYLTNTFDGCGDVISDSDLDLNSFIAHKAFCDTLISHTDKNGATVSAKRYTTNGALNTNDTRDLNISDLVVCSQGIFGYHLGKFQIISDTTGSSVMSFNPDNMYGDVTIVNDGFNSTLNKINVSFNSIDQKFQDDQVFLSLASNQKAYNEPELVQDTRLKYVNNNVMAERLANVIIKKSRDNLIVSFILFNVLFASFVIATELEAEPVIDDDVPLPKSIELPDTKPLYFDSYDSINFTL